MLGEHAAQIDRPGFGWAVGGLAFAASQFFWDHRHAGAIGADIPDGPRRALALARCDGPLRPLLGGTAHALNHPLNLAGRPREAAGLVPVPLGLEVGGFVGPLQAEPLGQGRGVAHRQAQGGLCWVMTQGLACMVIVIAAQLEAAQNPLPPKGYLALAHLPGLGLVSRVNALRCWLEPPAHQIIGRLENGRADQDFQFGDRPAWRGFGLKLGDQLLDFILLGEGDFRRAGGFFLEPAMSCRVSPMTSWAYSSVRCWYCACA